MPITVTMPQMGESVVEGVVARWLKHEGDAVARDEPFVEIMTDKVNAELPAETAGRLARILAPEGATVPVGAPLAEFLTEDELATAEPALAAAGPPAVVDGAAASQPATAAPATAAAPSGQARRYSPLVRRLAREHGLNLDAIDGTGLGGRVTKRDVLAVLEGAARPAANQPATAPAPAPSAPEATPSPALAAAGPDEEVLPLTPLRRAIAEHMVRSTTTAPHATTVHEVDLTRLVRWREAHKEAFRARYGVEITPLAFIIQATCAALRAFPVLNASWGGEAIILKKQINIGVAVALDDGLIVPVIPRADEKNLVGLARAVADLAQRARAHQLSPADVRGGTFTVNNVGVFGSLLSTPIINQPQAAILSAHAITRRVVVQPDDSLAIRSMMYLSLSFDHRITDGMTACRFVEHICRRLEESDDFPPR